MVSFTTSIDVVIGTGVDTVLCLQVGLDDLRGALYLR